MKTYAKALCQDCEWIVYISSQGNNNKKKVVCHFAPEPVEIDPELLHCSNYSPRRPIEFDTRPKVLPKS